MMNRGSSFGMEAASVLSLLYLFVRSAALYDTRPHMRSPVLYRDDSRTIMDARAKRGL